MRISDWSSDVCSSDLGGWAVALLAAECEGLDGPAVLNGSPLSYWAGAEDVNPMRLAGGLLGGEWLTHLLADLGGGRLDGAWLVQNFESLNPANTWRSEEHTSELQSLMRISYAVFCLKKKINKDNK